MNTNEKNRTLAKQLKIENLENQRKLIFEHLEKCRKSEDGNVEFTYRGDIYPEVKKELESQGFVVDTLNRSTSLRFYKCNCANVITISDDVILDDDEIEESKKYAIMTTKGVENNGHKCYYSSDKTRYKNYSEYDASRAQQSDEYSKSLNDDSVDSDYLPKLVSDIRAMRKADNQNNGIQTSDMTIYGCDPDLDDAFTQDSYPVSDNVALPPSSNSIPAVPTDAYNRQKRIQKAQNRQKRGRKGKH